MPPLPQKHRRTHTHEASTLVAHLPKLPFTQHTHAHPSPRTPGINVSGIHTKATIHMPSIHAHGLRRPPAAAPCLYPSHCMQVCLSLHPPSASSSLSPSLSSSLLLHPGAFQSRKRALQNGVSASQDSETQDSERASQDSASQDSASQDSASQDSERACLPLVSNPLIVSIPLIICTCPTQWRKRRKKRRESLTKWRKGATKWRKSPCKMA